MISSITKVIIRYVYVIVYMEMQKMNKILTTNFSLLSTRTEVYRRGFTQW